NVADRAHETGTGTVAGTFERGGNGPAFARLDVGQRERLRVLDQPGDFQPPSGQIDLWGSVMAYRIELVAGGDPTRQVLPVQHIALGLHVEERHDGFIGARLIEAEDGERSLSESKRRKR